MQVLTQTWKRHREIETLKMKIDKVRAQRRAMQAFGDFNGVLQKDVTLRKYSKRLGDLQNLEFKF